MVIDTLSLLRLTNRMDLKDYMRLKKQIDDKFKRESEALELLWRNHGNKDGSFSESQKTNVADGAREVIKALGETFSVGEVAEGLKNLGHEDVSMPQLSNLLNRFASRHEIAIVQKGKGRSPNVYRLLNDKDEKDELDFL